MTSRSKLLKAAPSLLALCVFGFAASVAPRIAFAEETDASPLLNGDWSFHGAFGVFDRAALRRGFQIYSEVCSACHGMKLLHYRNLGEKGGPEFSQDEVKAIAAQWMVEDGPDDEGDMFERPALPRDHIVSPFPNFQAARAANGGAAPPDLSLMTKSNPGGADFVYSLLQGYQDPPKGVKAEPDRYYNRYTGSFLAMAPPLDDDTTEYDDGTPYSLKRASHDVATFLAWAAEPKLEARKRTGFQVMVYLAILAALMYLATKRVWSRAHKEADEEEPSS